MYNNCSTVTFGPFVASRLAAGAARPAVQLQAIPEPPENVTSTLQDSHRNRALDAVFSRIIGAYLEALAGYRPLSQAKDTTSPEVWDVLVRWVANPIWDGARVTYTRICQPALNVIEGTICLKNSPRHWSLAVRLEHLGNNRRWVCTEFHVVGRP